MKIDIPYEIGDPVIVLTHDQRDGWDFQYTGFQYHFIPLVESRRVFRTYAEAQEQIRRLEERGRSDG